MRFVPEAIKLILVGKLPYERHCYSNKRVLLFVCSYGGTRTREIHHTE